MKQKNEIEILENWLMEATEIFNKKYGKIMQRTGEKTNAEIIEYNKAVTVEDYLNVWHRKLKKMRNGKIMPERVIKKIHNLPDLKTMPVNKLFKI